MDFEDSMDRKFRAVNAATSTSELLDIMISDVYDHIRLPYRKSLQKAFNKHYKGKLAECRALCLRELSSYSPEE